MHSQLKPYALSIEPIRTFIGTPEALWNGPGALFSDLKKDIVLKVINLNISLVVYGQK